ncbi:uncharacterized protein OCT59_029133 [Rhizophagus irregularis]|uniref:Kelch-like protein 17 n=3 Tax=Rhizophagus irregularis TaxID=588596 RepID=A0A015MZ38_RHIIW|nr:hypothetical protein GLOIN_2v1481345 [Rhizophagus irregularis DAOM 181602=DAOM 197198]EXX72058.1 hypothetical protein RirG_072890 [Rhizophagus irregularis DAOM 197198w]POG67696.1 hypothetical protein GLOIN_2v1481345 [Rhizophagus irregularis DAOM 181602=DAOM 197198]UZO08888.1 hypothetical protein OCT59_029133 [Rhizophagus irregularis]|eukprot:XP_025174562.1 hypothetical protein GLOIN_2v1481345 [Rhizophagus irregularis DAOM 181602=DAOM 197198]
MPKQFFSKLSQNYIEVLDDDEYYDITIEAGEDPNVKIFHAHMIVLCYRSPFLRRTLASNRKNDDGSLTHIKFPKISPENFHVIIKYIYGGVISLEEQEPLENFNILVAADHLCLQELIDYLQEYLIENNSQWIKQNFDLVNRVSFQSNSLLNLQQYCSDFMAKSPEKVFKSLDFTLLPENSLVTLIRRDDLQLKEVEVWNYVLKWGRAQNKTLTSETSETSEISEDPKDWTDNDFKSMEKTLQNCFPLIRFFSLSSEEFAQKVRPYKKLLKNNLYEELLNSYLDPNSVPNDNILLPRNRNMNGIINSKIVNLNIVSLVSRWIDKIDTRSKFAYARELYLPYKFKLLLRGSRDGFTPKKFHTSCDDKPHTITFIKVEGTGEILGGYNPSVWKDSRHGEYGKTKDSFIFSFKNKDDFKDPILSLVNNMDEALFNCSDYGPTFDNDLLICSKEDNSKNFNSSKCKQRSYEKMIREADAGKFSIEDYEVFLIIKELDELNN